MGDSGGAASVTACTFPGKKQLESACPSGLAVFGGACNAFPLPELCPVPQKLYRTAPHDF